ncbi:cysteine proteinase [Tothia fuscella]|uniref:Cysteine proteinase n=1 Tax=Tothia fuscella TaxID=1048955 RepID=A0A9P4P402_9PEZI|nr:cysteine proteinase [Tothia fuscella]
MNRRFETAEKKQQGAQDMKDLMEARKDRDCAKRKAEKDINKELEEIDSLREAQTGQQRTANSLDPYKGTGRTALKSKNGYKQSDDSLEDGGRRDNHGANRVRTHDHSKIAKQMPTITGAEGSGRPQNMKKTNPNSNRPVSSKAQGKAKEARLTAQVDNAKSQTQAKGDAKRGVSNADTRNHKQRMPKYHTGSVAGSKRYPKSEALGAPNAKRIRQEVDAANSLTEKTKTSRYQTGSMAGSKRRQENEDLASQGAKRKRQEDPVFGSPLSEKPHVHKNADLQQPFSKSVREQGDSKESGIEGRDVPQEERRVAIESARGGKTSSMQHASTTNTELLLSIPREAIALKKTSTNSCFVLGIIQFIYIHMNLDIFEAEIVDLVESRATARNRSLRQESNKEQERKERDRTMVQTLIKLLRAMKEAPKGISLDPGEFLEAFGDTQSYETTNARTKRKKITNDWNGSKAQDAAEFLALLLNILDKYAKDGEAGALRKAFSGNITTACADCGYEDTVPSTLWTASIPLAQQDDSGHPLEPHSLLKKRRKYGCNECKNKSSAVQGSTNIIFRPARLVVDLNRIQHDPNNLAETHKLLHKVKVSTDSYLEFHEGEIHTRYELDGLLKHRGGTNTGHYVSFWKSKDGGWFKWDDGKAANIDDKDIMNRVKKGVNGWDVAMLFYRKVEG